MVLEIDHERLEFHEVGQAGQHIQKLVVDLFVAGLEHLQEPAHIEVLDATGQLLNRTMGTLCMKLSISVWYCLNTPMY